MCLKLPIIYKAKVAKKAVKCYKVLVIVDGVIQTPYYDSVIKIGNVYNSEIVVRKNFNRNDTINVGLHSFKSLEAADNEYRYWKNVGAILVKCEIPIGSTYYKGDFEEEMDAYASTNLKYIKILKQTKKLIEED